MNGYPIICGGATGNISKLNNEVIRNVSKDCYEFKERTWNKTETSLDVPKFNLGTGNLVVGDKLLVHGGQKNGFSFVDSNEWIGLHERISPSGAQLLPVGGHCNMMYDDTHFIVTGGSVPSVGKKNFTVTTKTYICQVDLKKCTEGPSLNQQRRAHGCYKDEEKQYLYVVGGYIDKNSFNSTDNVEYLDLNEAVKKWKLGKN